TRPQLVEPYNPLQKLAYSVTIVLAAASVVTGLVLFNPVQFSPLAWLMGGFHRARVWHFMAMCGFLAFVPAHLLMVALHGWNNFAAMLVGWKRDPEYEATKVVPARVERTAAAPIDALKKEAEMVKVALLVRLEAKPGKEADVETFLRGGLAIVQEEPATAAWF